MGKEISRIRLNRLYSESNTFEEISFHDGVNIISVKRKRNIRSGYRGRSDHDKKKPETSGSACNHKRRENGIF